MADYQKMYAVLCSAVDEVIDPLEHIPLALIHAKILRAALAKAEEIYIRTAEDEEPEPPRVRESTIEFLPPQK